jgi:glycosyltransferase involved in cell wall biosynthesis
LTSDVEGVTEFIRQGENGWHYPRGDVTALARSMVKFAKQPEEVHMTAGGARSVLAMSEMARRLVCLYQSLQG